jgi:hypothetical protein
VEIRLTCARMRSPPLKTPQRTYSAPVAQSEPWTPSRRASQASTIAVQEAPVVTACRGLDVETFEQLVALNPDILHKTDHQGLTLLDIVISQGGRTHAAGANQLRLVRLLSSARVQFTLKNYPEYSRTYRELMQTIGLEDQIRRRSSRQRR